MMLAVGWLLQPIVLHVGQSGGLCGCPRSGLYHRGRPKAILTGSQPRPSMLLGQCCTPSVLLLRTPLHRSDHPRTNDTLPAVQRGEPREYDRLPYAPHGRSNQAEIPRWRTPRLWRCSGGGSWCLATCLSKWLHISFEGSACGTVPGSWDEGDTRFTSLTHNGE